MDSDIRWRQRFEHFQKALAGLEKACSQESYNDLERQGLIKGFEMCYELAWKVLQDWYQEAGRDVIGPKPVLREAFKDGLIRDADLWARLHEGRNLAAHTYDMERADRLEKEIRLHYLGAFTALASTLENRQ